ncbi:hypothetical protein [Desulfothermus sp.]
MFCPKCKYTTFDFYKKCPKCNYDWDHIRQDLNLEWMLEPDVIEEDISITETNDNEDSQEISGDVLDKEIKFKDQEQDLDIDKSDNYKEDEELELDPTLFIQESDNFEQEIEDKQDTNAIEPVTNEEEVEELLDITEIQEHDEDIESHDKKEEVWDIEFDDLIIEEENVEPKDKQTYQQDNIEIEKEIEILLEEDKKSE